MGLHTEAAALSHDIDFFGNRADALAAGRDWKAKTNIADFDDYTPNAAVVVVEIDSEKHGIDFMSSIAGVDSTELRERAVQVQAPGYDFYVMHPLHVMQSQLENVYGSLRRRNDPNGEYYAGRVALAIQVAGVSISDLLDAKRTRDALRFSERMGQLALSNPGLNAWLRDGVDVLDAIQEHSGWPGKFVSKRLPQIRDQVQVERDKFVKLTVRAKR
ncbi:MAG: hypothetical protein WD795_12950 [Woeseia sp.]